MKTFNKAISLVLTVAFILSFMAIPAFATGLTGFQTKSGNEKLVVEYYSDEGLSTSITSIKPGETFYAKVVAKLPTKTFASINTEIQFANATIDSEVSGAFNKEGIAVLAEKFEQQTTMGHEVNATDKTKAKIYVGTKLGEKHDSPTDNKTTYYINNYSLCNM